MHSKATLQADRDACAMPGSRGSVANPQLAELLFAVAESNAARVCLRPVQGEPWTYRQVHLHALEIGAELYRRGAQPGDRVLVQIDKSPQAVCLYLGCLCAGLVYVPLNTAYTASELTYFLDNAQPALLVRASPCPVPGATRLVLAEELFATSRGAPPLTGVHAASPDTPAAVLYTSGTTGRSKGAVLSYGNLVANARALRQVWAWQDEDVLLHALPIYHVHGLFVALHCAFFSGSEVRFLQHFTVEDVLAALPYCTVMMGVPTHYARLLESPAFDKAACAHMRVFISGSAPMTRQLHTQFKARTGHQVVERYGLTEGMILTSNTLDEQLLAGSVGCALPGVTLRIAATDATATDDATGEVQARGPGIFLGYLANSKATQEAFTEDGFLHTGDLGHLDEHGRLSITGRARDLIISGGLNVYPKEVEMLIDDMPGIRESAVIGVPHRDFGEAVVAVVVADRDVSIRVLREALAQHLARFKLPKQVCRVEELPRNQMGKVQKAELRRNCAHLFAEQFADQDAAQAGAKVT